jgi:UDP-glucose 4-epimerase
MRNMEGRVLITGAGGVIGSALVKCLTRRNYSVRAFVRSMSAVDSLPKSVDIVQGDITDERALRAATADVDYIFHLAAKLHVNNPSPTLRAEYKRVNVEGTHCVVKAAQSSAVKRLVFFSTINVYGASMHGQVLNENSPLHPDSWYAETKIQGEEIVRAQIPSQSVVLRLAAVYGRGVKGNYPRLLNALRRGRFAMIGDGSNRRTLVYINDVCSASLIAAEHECAVNHVYNVTDGCIHTLREIVDCLSLTLGKKSSNIRLPKGPVRFVAGLAEDTLNIGGIKSPVGRAAIDKFVEDMAVSGGKIQRELGFRPQYDLVRGWRETIWQK